MKHICKSTVHINSSLGSTSLRSLTHSLRSLTHSLRSLTHSLRSLTHSLRSFIDSLATLVDSLASFIDSLATLVRQLTSATPPIVASPVKSYGGARPPLVYRTKFPAVGGRYPPDNPTRPQYSIMRNTATSSIRNFHIIFIINS